MGGAFAKSREDVVAELGVDPEAGLDSAEVRRRLRKHGRNKLAEHRRRGMWEILVDQVKSLVAALLLLAALISFGFGEIVQGIAILIALLLNVGIGFFTELRATRSMEALKRMERTEATVRRDGQQRRIEAAGIVPGDIVVLNAGDIVPADLRVLEAGNLTSDESSLTGESVPVTKSPEAVAEDTPLAERASMVFKGTAVASGSGIGVVVATGKGTELGRISELAEETAEARTPLEQRLDDLALRLIIVILVVSAAVSVIGITVGRDLYLMVETGIALVVAAIPEGLPVVASIALARGMWRLAKRNALIEQLEAVETLGSVNVICSDKTGTLTENRMALSELVVADGPVRVAQADTRGDKAELTRDGKPVDIGDSGPLRAALEVAALCNTAGIEEDDTTGDPMERALVVGTATLDVDRRELLEAMPEARRVEFDSETLMMATVHETEEGYRFAVKGAPEAVLSAAEKVLTREGARDLGDDDKKAWVDRNEKMAAEGLRALALAQKVENDKDAEPYTNLTLLGLVGLIDPPREGIREAIEACRNAGINVVMITGDHPATAVAIAREVGLVRADEEARVMKGGELRPLDEMDEEERKRVLDTHIFARVEPAQKLDLIDIHQDTGSIVAMTGDGVNDAPALKKADIGIAMGRRGTQVAREAAAMVLNDDSFATIVDAVAQGRAIFRNIRRFIIYMLSGNAGEIFAVSAVALINAPLPLLPLQILYINIISDVFPALALGVTPGGQTMNEAPRRTDEAVLTRRHWATIGGYGLLIGGSVLAVFAYALLALDMSETRAVAISFATFSLARLLHTLNMREPETPLAADPVLTNRYVWGAIAIGVALLLAALYVPYVSDALQTVDPGLNGWILIGIGSVVPLIIGQLTKLRLVRTFWRKLFG
ncbi:cation-translocating P-type ATPase [Dichotomicrobium thermohalophilum]|uniref:Ca2+-transporting ATPase n=1 Tax=Dichotomicrobium thermohalophilum TaxID=933063 RepID=A0A397Q1L3_9HYPH|nr:cation-transporting P-type ATPase [Dichotomicrobium thermohalophilum]RIA55062.1 Ca2+-transporting ATPase [Dichotomicrobium thermohalophilum]